MAALSKSQRKKQKKATKSEAKQEEIINIDTMDDATRDFIGFLRTQGFNDKQILAKLTERAKAKAEESEEESDDEDMPDVAPRVKIALRRESKFEVPADVTSTSNKEEKIALTFDVPDKILSRDLAEPLMRDFNELWKTDDFKGLDVNLFVGFGMFNSHIYRKKFLRIASEAGLAGRHMTMVILLFTAIKNKFRVLESMDIFQKEDWYNPVKAFINKHIVQYTKEQSKNTFPAVNITSMAPSITAMCWRFLNPKGTGDEFLKNTWAAQMALPPKLMRIQKAHEIEFWTSFNISKNTKKTTEELGFHEKYYQTKAKDNYPFLTEDNKAYIVSNMDDLEKWLRKQPI